MITETTAASDGPTVFAQCRQRVADRLERVVAEALSKVAGEMETAAERSGSYRDRQSLFGAAALLRIEYRTRLARVIPAFEARVDRCLDIGRMAATEREALALLADEEVEAEILVGDVARTAIEQLGEEYSQFCDRVAALVPRNWDDDAFHPLGARTLASAAVSAFKGAAESGSSKAALREAAAARLADALVDVIHDANRFLRDQGVEPRRAAPVAARATDVVEPQGVGPSEPAAVQTPPASEAEAVEPAMTVRSESPRPPVGSEGADVIDRNAAMVGQVTDAARVLRTSALAESEKGNKLPVLPTLQPVVELERDAVAFAHSVGAMPYSRDARREFFGNVRQRMQTAGAPTGQVAVVGVVAALFDYVIDERRLPEAAKPLVWRLQQPAVALAMLDNEYLGEEPRSLRRLIENFGAIATAFSDEMERGGDLHRRMDTVVRAVEVVASVLQTRSAVIARHVDKEYERASRNVAQLIERVAQERTSLESTPERRNRRDYARRPSREREREVTDQIVKMLQDRLERFQVPESVREFVLNVWLRQLRSAVLRDGEESGDFKVALQTVDDLLWSLDTTQERQSRRELAQRIPPLIRLLTRGLAQMGARDEEFKPFFDELFLMHLRKMQGRGRRSAGEGRPGRRRNRDANPRSPTVPVLRNEVRATPAPEAAPPAPGTGEDGDTATAVAPRTLTRVAEAPTVEPAATRAEDAGEGRMLQVLNSLDLSDVPRRPVADATPVEEALERLGRGDWVELRVRENRNVLAKVAWVNTRRTVLLMVRHPDRKAMSLRIMDLRQRLQDGRARLVRESRK